jgi:serine/threonine-protein kinase HipA
MGYFSKDKYRGSYEAMFKAARSFIPEQERRSNMLKLFRLVAFSYAIENGDAHLKNFGLLYETADTARLAPAYDLVTTTTFDSLRHDSPALTLGGRKVWDAWGTLEQVATQTLLLRTDEVRGIFEDLHQGLSQANGLFRDALARRPEARKELERTAEAWDRGKARLGKYLLAVTARA